MTINKVLKLESEILVILEDFAESSKQMYSSSTSAQDLSLIHQFLKPLDKNAFISQMILIASSMIVKIQNQFLRQFH